MMLGSTGQDMSCVREANWINLEEFGGIGVGGGTRKEEQGGLDSGGGVFGREGCPDLGDSNRRSFMHV